MPLPPRQHSQFCSYVLPRLDAIRTCQLWTTLFFSFFFLLLLFRLNTPNCSEWSASTQFETQLSLYQPAAAIVSRHVILPPACITFGRPVNVFQIRPQASILRTVRLSFLNIYIKTHFYFFFEHRRGVSSTPGNSVYIRNKCSQHQQAPVVVARLYMIRCLLRKYYVLYQNSVIAH